MKQQFGAGVIGVYSFSDFTGVFTVVPSNIIELKEGFYPFTLNQSFLTNFNPSLVINSHGHTSLKEFESIVKEPIVGMGISGLMTAPIWGYKELKSLF
jgi:hypothetical protein